jgi:AcrR family transcriptional regulator
MAKNRREIDSEYKRQEILLAARHLLLAEGYDATSMSRLAKEAGVAPNTLYWYFKDKDELLIAILDELVAEALAEYLSVQAQSLDKQLLWLLEKFDAVPQYPNVASRFSLYVGVTGC